MSVHPAMKYIYYHFLNGYGTQGIEQIKNTYNVLINTSGSIIFCDYTKYPITSKVMKEHSGFQVLAGALKVPANDWRLPK